MFYHLLPPFADAIPGLGVFTYISFRAAGATVTAMLLSFVTGPWVIRTLRARKVSQVIREDAPEGHREKQGTPTMGGLIILLGFSTTI